MIMRADHAADFFSIQNATARDERLSLAARGLLVFLLSMSDDWQFSVNGLAKQLGIGRNKIIGLVKELQAAGYISIKKETKQSGKFSGAAWTIRETPENRSPENQTTENGTAVVTAVPKTAVPKTGVRKTGLLRNTNIKKDQYIKEIPKSSSTTPRTREKFTPPTLEQVKAYCQERNNNVDPQRWLDHYTSNGWKVGRNPMKDWKAAVRTWERSGFNDKPKRPADHPGQSQAAEQSKINEALRIAMQRAEGGNA